MRTVRKTAGGLLVSLLLGVGAWAPAQTRETWDFPAYQRAFRESGRDVSALDERSFTEAGRRKALVLARIEQMLVRNFKTADPAVMRAFREVPREYFMYNYSRNRSFGDRAYEIPPREWQIGYGSVLSDYIIQAYMTALLKPKPGDVSLEVGTGSGFQSALLSRIVRDAYTIEIIGALGEKVRTIFAPLGYTNVHTRVGDGFYGWPEVEGGFDIIIVTAQAPFVPPALLDQLKRNGRMVIPIGQPYKPQFLYVYFKDAEGKIHSRRDETVSFIPMTGAVRNRQK
jgi:protein-L-isoaspartate(D-aspartate) O-methyltransferase